MKKKVLKINIRVAYNSENTVFYRISSSALKIYQFTILKTETKEFPPIIDKRFTVKKISRGIWNLVEKSEKIGVY